ncbi:MAG: hypothetical protein J7M24_01100 [Candidatus Latescibacteria bacterium]|nr:hypothetical protein [Candidatus Latescibacterota bacterium]
MNRSIGRRTVRSRLIFFIAVFGVFVFGLSYVGVQMYILSLEDRVRELMRKRETIVNEVKSAEVAVAELRRAGRIKRVARDELGMYVPEGAPKQLY